jgi:hypothetical protein
MTDRAILPALEVATTNEALQAQFIEIAQKGQTPHKAADTTKGADAPKVDVGDAVFNSALSIKPTEIGEGFREAQAAAKTFMATPDKADALAKGAPAFEAAIKQSDSDYIGAIAKYSPEYNVKRQDVVEALGRVAESVGGLKTVISKVPEEQQEKVGHMVELALDPTISPALKASILKEMDQYPGLRQAAASTSDAIGGENKAMKAMTEAAQPLIKAAYDQTATRYIYAHAMELGGDKAKAYLMKEEGKSKMDDAYFEYLDKPKPPSPTLKA